MKYAEWPTRFSWYAIAVHSKFEPEGSVRRAMLSMAAMAWPELTPGAAAPLIVADGKRLYREITEGPELAFISAIAPTGTMLVLWLRTESCFTSSRVNR